MRVLDGEEATRAEIFFNKAAEVAGSSLCLRDKCGAIVVGESGKIIGRAYNAPPQDDISLRRCDRKHEIAETFKSDRTCCVHAEQRAAIDALVNNNEEIFGSRLYFMRLDSEGEMTRAGTPYCTLCSRIVLDLGIKEFALWHEEGITVYDSKEYNEITYQYK